MPYSVTLASLPCVAPDAVEESGLEGPVVRERWPVRPWRGTAVSAATAAQTSVIVRVRSMDPPGAMGADNRGTSCAR